VDEAEEWPFEEARDMFRSIEIARSSSCERSRLCCGRIGGNTGLGFAWEEEVDTHRVSIDGYKIGDGVIDERRLLGGGRQLVSSLCWGRESLEEGR